MDLVDGIVTTVENSFREAADFAHLTNDERDRLFGGTSGQFLNEGAFVGLPRIHPLPLNRRDDGRQ